MPQFFCQSQQVSNSTPNSNHARIVIVLQSRSRSEPEPSNTASPSLKGSKRLNEERLGSTENFGASFFNVDMEIRRAE
jgi:hypothetical protein